MLVDLIERIVNSHGPLIPIIEGINDILLKSLLPLSESLLPSSESFNEVEPVVDGVSALLESFSDVCSIDPDCMDKGESTLLEEARDGSDIVCHLEGRVAL